MLKENKRETWDEFFMILAKTTANRSKDPRTKVGAILVKDGRVIGLGYNGEPKHFAKTFDWNNREEKHKYVIHAEMNAIANASNLSEVRGATLYCTLSPCTNCCKLLSQFEIKKVYYSKEYEDFKQTKEFCDAAGINLIKM